MKHNFLKKLIATSVITSSIFSICPTTVLAAGVNYAGVGQTNGQWSKQGENWYYYVGGQLQKGWIYDRTGWYYADKNGVMQTGVVQIGGNIYLLADSGVMQTGTVVINGKVYTAGSDGVFYGDDLPVPTKSFDWYGTNDNIAHPSQVIDSSEDDSSSTNPVTAYDPLAPKEKFQVIFKDDDGEDLKIKNAKDGDTITLYKPTKKGYEFVEWNTKKNGDGEDYDYDDEIKVEKDIKLYAVWEEIEVTDDNAEDLGIVKVQDITIAPEGKKKEITTDKGTLKFSVDVLPVNADNKKVDWSVESETGKATISDNGLLTAEENGVVIVKATAKDGSGITDSIRITISGQKSGSGSGEGGSGNGSGSGSGTNNGELPVIVGDEAIINNSTSTELMKGNTYSTIRIATNNKEITLQNIKANKIVINGGDNIILDNCHVNYIEVLRPGTNSTVTLRNGSTAQIVNIERGVTLSGTGYNKVNVKTDEVVTINSGATIDTLNLTELISKIRLNGTVNTVNVASSAVNSVIEGNGSIGKLVTDATNIKLGVSSVGTIVGNAENTSLGGLIDKAKELEDITKEVEAAEKANSTNNAALIKKIEDKINANDPYRSEYETLLFRVEQLGTNTSAAANLKEARSYVSALEKVSKLDPTNTIAFNILLENDGSAKVTISGEGDSYTIDQLRTIALEKVKSLTPGLIDRTNLENRIKAVDTVITQGKKLNSMISNIEQSTTGAAVNFEADDYKVIGIDNVTKSYVPISNKYVSLLSNKTKFKDFKSVPASLSDDNISELVNILETDKSLIKSQVVQAVTIIKTKQKLEEDIDSFNDYIINNGLDTGETVSLTKLESIRDKYNSINEALNKLQKEITDGNIVSDDLKLRDENGGLIGNGYNELAAEGSTCKDKLSKYTLKFVDKSINSLYMSPVVSEGVITTNIDSAKISSSLTNNDLVEVRKTLNTIRTNYTDIIDSAKIQAYITALEKAQTQYEEVQKVLDALDGGIKASGSTAIRTDNGYILTVKFPTTGYSIDADNCTITAGSSAPKFNVNVTTGSGAELVMKTTLEATNTAYTISATNQNIDNKVGSLVITEESGKKKGTIIFTDLIYNTTFEVKDSAALSKTYTFKVNVTGKISSGEYVYTVTVSRI